MSFRCASLRQNSSWQASDKAGTPCALGAIYVTSKCIIAYVPGMVKEAWGLIARTMGH